MMDEAAELSRAPRNTRKPFGGKKRLYNVVKLRFRGASATQDYDAHLLDVERGDLVVVETSRGPAIAEIVSEVERAVLPTASLKKILRLASHEDRTAEQANLTREREAFRFALERIRARTLPMKLIQVQLMLDGSKAIFYFSSEGRIDFRDLVRDLANRFRTRIEMRQIGVRDGARMVGGIGSCGRELCCSTFLTHFAPVSIRMAKDQGLTLNPKKVSGMCGRLMCCLVYEQHIYRKTQRRLPRAGKIVDTARGLGTIRTVDVVQESAGVLLDDGSFETFPIRDLVVLSTRDAEQRRGGHRPSVDRDAPAPIAAALTALQDDDDGEPWLWEDEEPPPPQEAEAPQTTPRRGRRRGAPSPQDAPAAAADAPQARRPRRERAEGSERPERPAAPGGASNPGAPRRGRPRPDGAAPTPPNPAAEPAAQDGDARRSGRRRGGRRRRGRGEGGDPGGDKTSE